MSFPFLCPECWDDNHGGCLGDYAEWIHGPSGEVSKRECQCDCRPIDPVAALARELAACRLALLNERTDKEAAQAEAAALRDARTASMADALTATHTTRLSMFGRSR
jgi:hypothetical protein